MSGQDQGPQLLQVLSLDRSEPALAIVSLINPHQIYLFHSGLIRAHKFGRLVQSFVTQSLYEICKENFKVHWIFFWKKSEGRGHFQKILTHIYEKNK